MRTGKTEGNRRESPRISRESGGDSGPIGARDHRSAGHASPEFSVALRESPKCNPEARKRE